jgi:hypothetical protein
MLLGSAGGYFCVSENEINLWGTNCNNYFVGITRYDPVNFLSISPNPAKSCLTIHLNESLHNITFKLWDLSGQLIISRRITEPETKINITGISPGLYGTQVLFDEGSVNSRVIIIE